MSLWWPLLGLLSWYLIFKSSHSFEGRITVYISTARPRSLNELKRLDKGSQDGRLNNGRQVCHDWNHQNVPDDAWCNDNGWVIFTFLRADSTFAPNYKLTPSLIGWAQTLNQPWISCQHVTIHHSWSSQLTPWAGVGQTSPYLGVWWLAWNNFTRNKYQILRPYYRINSE